MVGDVLGNRNNLIPHRHDRVIAALERIFIPGIRPVERRHKRNSGLARRKIGTPGRCTRTGMDDIHTFFRNKLHQCVDILAHGQDVFGLQRQIDMLGPKAVQFALKPSPLGCDKRLAATINNGTGNINRSALDPTGVKFWQNL